MISIKEEILSPTDPLLATAYKNTAMVYLNIEEYSQALSYLNKSLATYDETLPADHPHHLVIFYNCIGVTHCKLEEYPKAKSFLEKALEIKLRSLPLGHPDIEATQKQKLVLLFS